MVPVVVGIVLCGVRGNVLSETQYEYRLPSSVVPTLPEVVNKPLVDGLGDTNPIPPVFWTWAWQVHPPPAAATLGSRQ
jgi:hypothetical protein